MTKSILVALSLAVLVTAGTAIAATGPCKARVCRKAVNKCAHAICKPVHGAAKGFCLKAYRHTWAQVCQANAVDTTWCTNVVEIGCSN